MAMFLSLTNILHKFSFLHM